MMFLNHILPYKTVAKQEEELVRQQEPHIHGVLLWVLDLTRELLVRSDKLALDGRDGCLLVRCKSLEISSLRIIPIEV